MHPVILSVGIENGRHWSWPSRSFWQFWLESQNCHQTCILRYSQLVLKMEVIDLDFQCYFGHLDLNSRKFDLSAKHLVMDLVYNHHIYTNYASRDSLSWYWKWGSSILIFQGHLTIISTQEIAFNVGLVYWSRPANGCYTSQTYSCKRIQKDIQRIPFFMT